MAAAMTRTCEIPTLEDQSILYLGMYLLVEVLLAMPNTTAESTVPWNAKVREDVTKGTDIYSITTLMMPPATSAILNEALRSRTFPKIFCFQFISFNFSLFILSRIKKERMALCVIQEAPIVEVAIYRFPDCISYTPVTIK
jgi:hypothetical protein